MSNFHLIRTLKDAVIKLLTRSTPSVVKFACSRGGYYTATPVTTARELVPEFVKDQVRNSKAANNGTGKGIAKFVRCPGMHDLSQQGYLVYAHTDIHIMASKHTVVVDTPLVSSAELGCKPMDFEVIDGLAPIPDNVKKGVFKVPCPWGVHTEPGYSAHVLPAFFHFPHFDKVYVYPGTVDYDDFHTLNFIISPIAQCDFVIHAGTPLLQILPFKREDFHGASGPATDIERDRHLFGFPTRAKGAYRRLFFKKKTFTIEVTK